MINEKNIIKEKIEYFYKKGKPIHFKVLSGEFRNGYILQIEKDYFILNELVMSELPIHYIEIKLSSISECKSRKLKEKL